jgi:hypothetical protein
MQDDGRLDQAKAIPMAEVIDRLGVASLVRAGGELVGPCPVCGGRDRFGVNVSRHVFTCRHCDVGGDQVALVQHVLGCDFRAALAYLVGDADVALDPAEVARRKARAESARADAQARAARERAAAIRAAREIWNAGVDAEGTPVRAYLVRRGFDEARLRRVPGCLRYHAALPYMVRGADGWHQIHIGPAMLAAVQAPDGSIAAVHRTWIDLDQPKGKAKILHEGTPMQAKKVLGSKKGGAIRLSTPRGAQRMVMAEGIETTLTAGVARVWPGAAYWAGVDLGNMAGRRILSGTGMKYAGVPDLEDAQAFLPPPWVQHLIFIQDGDSAPQSTRAKLLAGLRRARAQVPGVARVSIVHAGDGRDLNDILMGDAS